MNQIAAALIFLAGALLMNANNESGGSFAMGIGLILFTISYVATSYVGFTRWRTETKNDA